MLYSQWLLPVCKFERASTSMLPNSIPNPHFPFIPCPFPLNLAHSPTLPPPPPFPFIHSTKTLLLFEELNWSASSPILGVWVDRAELLKRGKKYVGMGWRLVAKAKANNWSAHRIWAVRNVGKWEEMEKEGMNPMANSTNCLNHTKF
jgi:hypothetical protein